MGRSAEEGTTLSSSSQAPSTSNRPTDFHEHVAQAQLNDEQDFPYAWVPAGENHCASSFLGVDQILLDFDRCRDLRRRCRVGLFCQERAGS